MRIFPLLAQPQKYQIWIALVEGCRNMPEYDFTSCLVVEKRLTSMFSTLTSNGSKLIAGQPGQIKSRNNLHIIALIEGYPDAL